MPASASTAGEVEVFRNQARATHGVVKVNLDGVTHDESMIQPRPGGNCLNWVLGHLVCTYENVLPMLGQKPVMEPGAMKRYARGAPPMTDASEARDLGELMAAWNEAAQRVDAGLEGLTPETLAQRAPHSPSGNPDETIRSLLSVIFFHQAYHAGQTGVLRRITGKKGAIA